MIVFARKHKKPVFISEATPVRQIDNLYFDSDLKKVKIRKNNMERMVRAVFQNNK